MQSHLGPGTRRRPAVEHDLAAGEDAEFVINLEQFEGAASPIVKAHRRLPEKVVRGQGVRFGSEKR